MDVPRVGTPRSVPRTGYAGRVPGTVSRRDEPEGIIPSARYVPGVLYQQRKFAVAAIGWPLCALLILVVSGLMVLDLYFVVSLVGFLIIVELTAPVSVSLRWRRMLPLLVAVGLLGFVYILARRALTALPPDAIGQLLG